MTFPVLVAALALCATRRAAIDPAKIVFKA